LNHKVWFVKTPTFLTALLGVGSAGIAVAQDPAAQETNATVESALDAIVVTGYTTQKKKDIVGAVSVADLDEIKDRPSGSIIQNLQGQIPGVQINTDGNPSGNASVLIRGQGLGPLGFNAPLYIVDGVPLNTTTGLQELNPKDIESVQVLRDAASAAIYGARAANGVIVITTKRGTGHMDLNVTASETWQYFSYNINPLTTGQRAAVLYQAGINSGTDPNTVSNLYKYTCVSTPCSSSGYSSVTIGAYADAAGNRYIDPALTQRVSNTNWFKAVTEDSKITESTISLSNSTEDSRFYSSVGYYDAHGVVKDSQFRRLSFRINADHTFFDGKLIVSDNLMLTDQKENAVNYNAAFILAQALETQSIIPIYTTTGGYGGPAAGTTDHRQPVEVLNDTKGATSDLNKLLGNLYAELRPIDGLTLRTSVGSDYSQKYYRNYTPGGYTGNVLLIDNLNTSYIWNRSITVTDTADYKFTLWAKNHFEVLGGYENIDYHTENFYGAGFGFASPADTYTFLSQATQNVTAGGGGDSWTLRSYFGKLNYDYDGKYLASATVRRDGSSRFGANNRWGIFPSAAVGWRLSQEEFFKIHWINDLKFRLSDGTNGNQEISTAAGTTIYSPRYSTTSLFANPVGTGTCPGPNCQQEIGTAYDLNGVNTGTLPSGFAKTATGNPNLKWETSKQINFGVDFVMFNNHLDGAFDVYRKRTSNILTTTVPLATAGEGAQSVVNGGTVDNRGWELELGHRIEFTIPHMSSPLNLHLSGNISHATNKVISLPADVVSAYPGNGSTQTILGRSINSIYGYSAGGIFQNAAQVAASGQPGAYVGGLRIVDVNHDGKIDANDQRFLGTTDPKYIFGVNFDANYRDWSFNMAWQGVKGGLIYNYFKGLTDFTANPGANYGGRVLSAWTPANTGSSIPAAVLSYGQVPDSYFYESASYIKLRNLALSYNLPESLRAPVHVKRLRVYLQGENLLILKPKGTVLQDPEQPNVGDPIPPFPIPKRFTVGFDGSF